MLMMMSNRKSFLIVEMPRSSWCKMNLDVTNNKDNNNGDDDDEDKKKDKKKKQQQQH